MGGPGSGRRPAPGHERLRSRAARLRAAGLTWAEIGRRLGVSRQRVQYTFTGGRPMARAFCCRGCGRDTPAPGLRRGNQELLCRDCLRRLPAVRFAVLLRSLRALAGLTQARLAARCGLAMDTVRHLEGGRRPGPRTAARLLEALGASLLTGEWRQRA